MTAPQMARETSAPRERKRSRDARAGGVRWGGAEATAAINLSALCFLEPAPFAQLC